MWPLCVYTLFTILITVYIHFYHLAIYIVCSNEHVTVYSCEQILTNAHLVLITATEKI